MSVIGYFSVARDGTQVESPLRRLLRLEAEKAALGAVDDERERGEIYRAVEDYDPVLRFHCRV